MNTDSKALAEQILEKYVSVSKHKSNFGHGYYEETTVNPSQAVLAMLEYGEQLAATNNNPSQSDAVEDKRMSVLTPYGQWVKDSGWQLHSSGRYWFKLDYPSQWPTPHTADEDELYKLFLSEKGRNPSQEVEEERIYNRGYMNGLNDAYRNGV